MAFDIVEAYAHGLVGCSEDPEADRRFDEYIRANGGDPVGADVVHEWGLKDLGRGKLVTPWVVVEKVFPGCWPGAAQDIGDCFPAGTMVSMADGTQKPIEAVSIGDTVISHKGVPRPVLSTILKPFDGVLIEIQASCCDQKVAATPDHQFVVVEGGEQKWRAIGDITVGDVVMHHGDSPVSRWESYPFSGFVYCIEVEEDHSFLANGYAVHNCVSHGTKNACLITLACEIYDAKADEVTGRIEGAPEISEEGLKEGALSTEAIYWWRGHGGANGWNCADSARQVTTNAGLWPRKNYEEIGIDLTTYSGSKATKWGGSPPPENVAKIGREHLIRTATKVSGREQVRDFLAAGFGVFNCSGLGFSRTRDEHGVSRQSGSWSHSQAFCGYDDRPETHEEYGQALVCWINSWGVWNSGGRRVRGTDLDIPEGSFWALAETIDSCSCFALSSVAGWPRRKMPDYGARGYI